MEEKPASEVTQLLRDCRDGDRDALDALQSLATIDPRRARVVELQFFRCLSRQEISEASGIATATAQHDWTSARPWRHREISRKPAV